MSIQESLIKPAKRSCYCGLLDSSWAGKRVTLMGWVRRVRDHGHMVFMDLRDKTGYVQVVFESGNFSAKADGLKISSPKLNPATIGLESVVMVQGVVQLRPKNMVSKKISTGEVELIAQNYKLLSVAKTPPFLIEKAHKTQNLALKYRYLDLRSSQLQRNLLLAHKLSKLVREELSNKDFIEVSTPVLYKSTPEGARDFLVPSRNKPGHFYALIQSPQIVKQLLMIGSVDRYFQLVHCFRDEDLRADRQFEFTQIDMEMSFATMEDVMEMSQYLVQKIWKKFKNQDITSIPILSYQTALDTYGSDKPDLRNPFKMKDISQAVKNSGFRIFEQSLQAKGVVKAIAGPDITYAKHFSNTMLKKLEKSVKDIGLSGLLWIKVKEDGSGFHSSVGQAMEKSLLKKCFECSSFNKPLKPPCVVFIIAGDKLTIHQAGEFLIKTLISHFPQLIDKSKDRFVWIKDFPLLEYDTTLKRWKAKHHPFTAPVDKDKASLLKGEVQQAQPLTAQAYDLVCNGQELAGGSVRIHQPELQRAYFKTLGFSSEEIEQKFGFFLEALSYGTPPHAGIAWGFERLLMILSGTEQIKDVIAFPKTTSGLCLMSSAPSVPEREQLLELGLQVLDKKSLK